MAVLEWMCLGDFMIVVLCEKATPDSLASVAKKQRRTNRGLQLDAAAERYRVRELVQHAENSHVTTYLMPPLPHRGDSVIVAIGNSYSVEVRMKAGGSGKQGQYGSR